MNFSANFERSNISRLLSAASATHLSVSLCFSPTASSTPPPPVGPVGSDWSRRSPSNMAARSDDGWPDFLPARCRGVPRGGGEGRGANGPRRLPLASAPPVPSQGADRQRRAPAGRLEGHRSRRFGRDTTSQTRSYHRTLWPLFWDIRAPIQRRTDIADTIRNSSHISVYW